MKVSMIHTPVLRTICLATWVAVSFVACGEADLPPGEDLEEVVVPSQSMGSDDTDSSDTTADDSTGTDDTSSDATQPDEVDAGDDTDATDTTDTTDTDDTETETPDEPVVTVVDYAMNDTESLLYAQVWKDDTLLSGFAHDHVIRATGWTGSLTYDPQDLSSCAIAFELAVADMRNDEPAMREFTGLEGEIEGGDRETIRENMLSEDQLNVDTYPTISFASTSCEGEGGSDGELIVNGGMTIRGVTKNISVPVNFQIRDGKFYVQGTIDSVHADFGMEPYSAFFGSVKNADALQMNFDMVGSPE